MGQERRKLYSPRSRRLHQSASARHTPPNPIYNTGSRYRGSPTLTPPPERRTKGERTRSLAGGERGNLVRLPFRLASREEEKKRAVLEVVEDLRRSYPSLTFGVGTVLNADDAKKAITAGAQFLMSPGTVMEILRDLEGSEILYIPGVLTPTEVYPVSVIGGEIYMSALKKPFPLLPMVASQGITIGSIKSYIEAGASAVVLSDAIFDKELIGERNFIGISALANQATSQASHSGR